MKFGEAAEPVGVGADGGVGCGVEVAVAALLVAAEEDGERRLGGCRGGGCGCGRDGGLGHLSRGGGGRRSRVEWVVGHDGAAGFCVPMI